MYKYVHVYIYIYVYIYDLTGLSICILQVQGFVRQMWDSVGLRLEFRFFLTDW